MLSQKDEKILVGGSGGLWVYDATSGESTHHEELSQQTLQGPKMVRLHLEDQPGQVLVTLSKSAARQISGGIPETASYLLFNY